MPQDERQHPQLSHRTTAQESTVSRSLLTHWIQQVLRTSQVQVKLRLRGNNLYLLCESQTCPDAEGIVRQLERATQGKTLDSLLSADAPELHRIICYGRVLGQKQPSWSRDIPLSGYKTEEKLIPTAPGRSDVQVEALSSLELAKQGNPTAIAHYLSSSLTAFGIGIRVKVEPYPSSSTPLKRLLVLCESGYTPDPALLADPIAQRLRELALTRFRDAVVFGQVNGEHRPEWMVRVDLTPPEQILQEWAHWGDVQAIARQLNCSLTAFGITLAALLKEKTLHLSCTSQTTILPDQVSTVAAIKAKLQILKPQGIQAAVIYGVTPPTSVLSSTNTAPGWVYLLELAAADAEAAVSTLELAKQGDGRALTFLLTRLLNPNLDDMLATGGIRVQIRQKGDLLHILTEAPNCPRQDAVAPAVMRCLKPLQISGVAGIRLYGRIAGQKQPLWSYGVDFIPRQHDRLVPEATPEFAASDAPVDELLAPPGAIVPWTELLDTGLTASIRRWCAQSIAGIQRVLIRTQLFIPVENPSLTSTLTSTDGASSQTKGQRARVALLWSAIGLLLIVQIDWVLGYWLRLNTQQQASIPTSAPSTAVPTVSPSVVSSPTPNLNQNPQAGGFNSTPFTQPGTIGLPSSAYSTPPGNLPASPLQAKAEPILAIGDDYPTFNSRQLDGQIELYRRYLEINGAPDVLIIGSSRALRGVDPIALETALAKQGYQGIQIFNFGINGATAQVVDLIVQQLLPQDKRPKLILFADGARAFNSGREDITYNGVIASAGYKNLAAGSPLFPGSVATSVGTAQPQEARSTTDNGTATPTNIYQQWNDILNQRLAILSATYRDRDQLKTQLRQQFTVLLPKELSPADVIATSDRLIDSSPSASASGTESAIAGDAQNLVDIDGFLPLSVQFNPLTYYQKYARVSGDYDSDYKSFTLTGGQTEAMRSLARYAHKHQIPLVFVNLPLTQQYLDPVRKRYEQEFQQFMTQLSQENGFFYRNLENVLLTQPQYFSDPSHLNRYGAYNVSQRLAQDVMIPWELTR